MTSGLGCLDNHELGDQVIAAVIAHQLDPFREEVLGVEVDDLKVATDLASDGGDTDVVVREPSPHLCFRGAAGGLVPSALTGTIEIPARFM